MQTDHHLSGRQSDKLGAAIVASNERKVRALLASGVPPDTVVWRWDTALFLAIRLRRVSVARILLAAGASPRMGASGRSPLRDAIRKGHKELVGLLLQHGAPPDEGVRDADDD